MELFDDARTIDAKNVLQELNVERRRAVVNDAVDEFLWNECQSASIDLYRLASTENLEYYFKGGGVPKFNYQVETPCNMLLVSKGFMS